MLCCTWNDILHVDSDVAGAVLAGVLVEEAENVHQFVDDSAHVYALLRVEVHHLSAPGPAH